MFNIRSLVTKLSNCSRPRWGFHRCTHQDQSLTARSTCGPLATMKKLKTFGQPSPATHPHLLKDGEVTPGILKSEFKERRRRLMESILKQGMSTHEHLVVIPSASKTYMSDKIPYPFRQDTDFLYLSGFLEPNSVLILHNQSGRTTSNSSDHAAVLFVPKKDQQMELWDGPRSGIDGAIELLGVDEAYNMEDLEHFLQKFARSTNKFSVWCDVNKISLSPVASVVTDLLNNNQQCYFNSPTLSIHNLRLIKSDAEIRIIKESCRIAAESMKNVIQTSHPMVTESLLMAKMEFESKIRGASYPAFPPVVAGGPRANTIHYIKNDQKIKPRDMVLMDAGCEYHGYSSDMTRTWPVNGKFTPAQRELYEAVLFIQEQMIRLCNEFITLDEMFNQMSCLVGEKLQELCIIPPDLSAVELAQLSYQHCPHHVSHYLGMDVHDTPQINRNIHLRPGMVITIEPGIYIPENCGHSPARYKGLGIRIEDDILITQKGPVVLTRDCPKELDEIEQLFCDKTKS